MILGRCARSFGDFKMCRRERPMMVTEALQTVVSKAIHEGRLITGITEMAAVLKRFSGSGVMFCIVEIKSVEDFQMKLLEAYCREHHIKLIKDVNNTSLICACVQKQGLRKGSVINVNWFIYSTSFRQMVLLTIVID